MNSSYSCFYNDYDLCTFGSKCLINNITNTYYCNCDEYPNLIFDNTLYKQNNCVNDIVLLIVGIISPILNFGCIVLLIQAYMHVENQAKKLVQLMMVVDFFFMIAAITLYFTKYAGFLIWFSLFIFTIFCVSVYAMLMKVGLSPVYAIARRSTVRLYFTLNISFIIGCFTALPLLALSILSEVSDDEELFNNFLGGAAITLLFLIFFLGVTFVYYTFVALKVIDELIKSTVIATGENTSLISYKNRAMFGIRVISIVLSKYLTNI